MLMKQSNRYLSSNASLTFCDDAPSLQIYNQNKTKEKKKRRTKCTGATLIKGGMSLLPRAWREPWPVMLSERRPLVVVYGMDMSTPVMVVRTSVSDHMVRGMSPRGGMMRMMTTSDCGIRSVKIRQRRGNGKQ